MDKDKGTVDRREFVIKSARWLAGGTVLSFVLGGCGDGDTNPAASDEPITINLADAAYAALDRVGGSAKVPRRGGKPIVLVRRDGDTFVAFSSRCTHTGCEVDLPDDNGIVECPCHGSRFDSDGRRLSGPARADLPAVEIDIAGQVLTLTP